jgi:sortase A
MLETVAVVMIVAVAGALVWFGPAAWETRGRRPRAPRHLVPTASTTQAAPIATVPTVVLPGGPVGALVGVLRRKRWLRRSMSALSVGLLLGAVAMLGYPFYTNLVQSRLQAKLDRQIASPELKQAYIERRVEEGDSLTRIRIPKLDVDVVVVEGTSASALRAGAGHYPQTPLPCEVGNVAIAGHRTTYGRPFHNVDLLAPGDEIILETPIGTCTYEVDKAPFPVSPTTWQVVENTPDRAMLTLTTCHPKGSARQRLIVQSHMVSSKTEAA